MKRGNQMIKKLSVTVFSMFILMSLGWSSAWTQHNTDESGAPLKDSVSYNMTVEEYNAFRAEHYTNESGPLPTLSSVIDSRIEKDYKAFWAELYPNESGSLQVESDSVYTGMTVEEYTWDNHLW